MAHEITIYQKVTNGIIKLYCESCKPRGGTRGTLVVSCYDSFCADCGRDFLEMAEQATAESSEELSPSDLTSIEAAMSGPVMGTYTFEELCQILEQASKEKLADRLANYKTQVAAMGESWLNVISHAVPYDVRTYANERITHMHLDYIDKYLSQPVCFRCQHIRTNKQCPRCHQPLCGYCEWGTLDMHINACPECALVLRGEQEALQQAWDTLQSTASYVEVEAARFVAESLESALDCGILPTEMQPAEFDTSEPY